MDDLRLWGAVIVLLVIFSGGAVIAVLTFGQVIMVLVFVVSVVAAIGRRFRPPDSTHDPGQDGSETHGPTR